MSKLSVMYNNIGACTGGSCCKTVLVYVYSYVCEQLFNGVIY